MDISVESKSSVEKKIIVTIPVEEVTEFFENQFITVAKTAKVNGFRPGKVPIKVAKKLYAKQVQDEAKSHFVQQGYQKALVDNQINPVIDPVFDISDEVLTQDNPFSFSFAVEILPELNIELQEYTIPFTEAKFEEKMLKEEVEAFRKRLIEYEESEELSAKDDKITISFKGTIAGESIEGTDGDDVDTVVGSGQFVPDFDAALEDKKAGESFVAAVTFPEDYHGIDIAGKTVDFAIEVKKVLKSKGDIELTDEYLKEKEGLPDTVAEVTSEIEKNIKEYIERINRDNKRGLVVEKYVKENEIEVPPTFVKMEIDHRKEEFLKKEGNENSTIDEETLKSFEDEALFAVRRYVIMNKLSADHKITATEAEVDALIAAEAAQYGVPVEYIKQIYDEQRINEKRHTVVDEKTMDLLASKAQFVDKPAEEKTDD
ncbi:trigger factor [bacterium]|nr:trigger factor [bacterium]